MLSAWLSHTPSLSSSQDGGMSALASTVLIDTVAGDTSRRVAAM